MAVSPRPTGPPVWMSLTLFALVLLVGGFGLLLSIGEPIVIPWFGEPIVLMLGSSAEAKSAPEGRVPVPLTARTVRAYDKVGRDDVWDSVRGELSVTWMQPEAVAQGGVITDLASIVGRVLSRDKAPGFVFTERDFLPEGTRAGLVAGIPAGKRALRIEVDKVAGPVGLHPGDRFDLVTAVPVGDARRLDAQSFGGPYGGRMALAAQFENITKQARVSTVVQSGVIVTAVESRQIPVSASTLTQGLVTRQRVVQEVVVAIEPDEVPALVEALSIEIPMVCVPRSGRPDDPLDSLTPSSRPQLPWMGVDGSLAGVAPAGGMVVIEGFDGAERALLPVPRGGR